MKGKKFDAHEEHFRKKETKLNREIRCLEERCSEVNNINIQLTKENEKLKQENLDVKLKYEKLLEYSKLSDKEIEDAVQGDKSVNRLSEFFDIMPNMLQF